MKKRENLKESAGWVELPTGIFTADGIWFHTTESALREFADDVVERVGVGPLLMQAGSWFRSAETACAIVLAILILLIPPVPAGGLALLLYILWDTFAPSLVILPLVRAVSFLSGAAVQGILFVVVVSWLGMNDQIASAALGLLGFIALRWGLVRKAADALRSRRSQEAESIPVQDRILRSLVMRHAVALGVTIPSLETYEQRILEIWSRGKHRG